MPRKKGNWVFIQMGSGRKQLKIIAATSMTIFSLLTCFMGAYAWFNAKRTADNSSDGFGIYYDDSAVTVGSVYCVKYDGINGAVATELTANNHAFVMSEYDSIFTDRNVNTPLFLRIVLNEFDRAKKLTVEIPCSNPVYRTDNNTPVSNWLSNVVCAKFSYGLKTGTNTEVKDSYTLSGSTIYGGNALTIYEGMRDKAADLTGTAFVTDADQRTKNSTISIDIAAETIPASYIDDGKIVVYIAFDYYVTNSVNLVKKYLDSYPTPGSADRVFQSDIGIIRLRDNE